MAEFDNIDRKILFELSKNCRRSNREIATLLNLKIDTVAYRIKRLEKEKIIKGYYTVIDYSRIGYNLLIRTYIRFQNTTTTIEKEIVDFFLSQKFIFTIYLTEGDWDIATGYLGNSLQEFYNFNITLKEKYKKYINKQRTAIFTNYKEYNRNYLVEQKLMDYSELSIGNSDRIFKLDETDNEILKFISEKGKFSILELANKLKLTSTAVIYRIKDLEKKKIILGYKALVDISKIGYRYYKVDLEIDDMTKLKELQMFAKQHPNIIFEDRTIGGSDFEFDAELKDDEEFYALMSEIKDKFPGMIRSYSYYKARNILLYKYFPD